MTKDYGPLVKTDNAFMARCRYQQSKYRVEVLKEDYGAGPTPASTTRYGNYLINGEITGSNFISPAAFAYAKQRVRDKIIQPELTIDQYRLFNNMLSSMPLCFNLFSDLRDLLLFDLAECTAVIKALFKEISWIDGVDYIGVEFIPTPIDFYTGDKSAFDAIIITKDSRMKKGLITIETKYTDILGNNNSSNNKLKDELIKRDKIFTDEATERLLQKGYTQIYRNFLLTYAYSKRHLFSNFANVIISPEEDKESMRDCERVAKELRVLKNLVYKVDLEEFVERGIKSDYKRVSEVYGKIKRRYFTDGDEIIIFHK